MTRPGTQEPPGGDFVAYIERLQRESAARLAQAAPAPHVPAPTGRAPNGGPTSAPHDVAARADHMPGAQPAPKSLGADEARELLARLQRRGGLPAWPLLAMVFGLMLLAGAILFNAGPFQFFAGFALLVWGLRRLGARKSRS